MNEFERVVEALLPAHNTRVTAVWGGAPYQAYGWLDGERFYFKYRYGTARLTVGTVDVSKELEYRTIYHRKMKERYTAFEQNLLNGTEDARDLHMYQMLLQDAESDLCFTLEHPTIIPRLISKEGFVEHGDEYDMLLDDVTAGNLFVECVYTLTEPAPQRKNMYLLFENTTDQ